MEFAWITSDAYTKPFGGHEIFVNAGNCSIAAETSIAVLFVLNLLSNFNCQQDRVIAY